MAQMLAAVYGGYGPARDVLDVREIERPEPGPGQVLVRVAVSAVNPTDVKTRSGRAMWPIEGFQVPHQDGAGVIEDVGPGVDAGRVGQRVWLLLAAHRNRWGTAAQYALVPSELAVPVPDDLSLDLAATFGVPAVTAADCLFADGPITGRDVLVAGGAGAVGRYAIQLARWAGARVCATVSSQTKAEVARTAGAHQVINYHDHDALDQLREWSTDVERIVEVNLGANVANDLAVSRPGTTAVVYATDGPAPEIPVREFMGKGLSLRFMLLYTLTEAARAAAVHAVSAAAADGAFTMPPLHRYALQDIAAAHEAQESGAMGKILVDLP
jgi:NADPH:quinone reductase